MQVRFLPGQAARVRLSARPQSGAGRTALTRWLVLRGRNEPLSATILHMLNGNERQCDVCGSEIAKGEKYRLSVVSKKNAGVFRSIMQSESDPDLIPTSTEDAKGNIRLDICLDCYMHMGSRVGGTEAVN